MSVPSFLCVCLDNSWPIISKNAQNVTKRLSAQLSPHTFQRDLPLSSGLQNFQQDLPNLWETETGQIRPLLLKDYIGGKIKPGFVPSQKKKSWQPQGES